MIRKKPLKPGTKRLRQGRSTGAPTKAEAHRIVESKFGRCIPCLSWALAGNMPMENVMIAGDYDHKKSGNIRRGHMKGYCACKWHHVRHPGEGWTFEQMRAHFGPSLLDGSKLYRDAYGSDDALIELQTQELAA
jgi:hypothetical protein